MNTVAEMIKPIPGPFFAVLIGYFVLMAIIGYVSSKQTNNLKDFFVMSGKAGAVVLSGRVPVSPFEPLVLDVKDLPAGTYYMYLKGAGLDGTYTIAKI